MELTVKWAEKMAFSGATASGHEIRMDAAEEIGGQNSGARPMELVLNAIAGCTGINVIWILKRMHLEPISFHMEMKGDRTEEPPNNFTNIHIHYVFEGELPEQKVVRAIQLANDEYCSVTHSLNTKITDLYSINGI